MKKGEEIGKMATATNFLNTVLAICTIVACLFLIYHVVMKKYKGTFTRIAYFILYSFLLLSGAYYVFSSGAPLLE